MNERKLSGSTLTSAFITIELFSGPKIFSSVAEALGYETFTVDREAATSPTLVADLTELQGDRLPQSPLVVWAAPPDGGFNVDDHNLHWDEHGYPISASATAAMNTYRAALRLINEVKAKWWFLENPYGPLRHFTATVGYNRGYPTRNRITIDHANYGDIPPFRTDVWTNAFWWQPRYEALSRLARRPANAKVQIVKGPGRRLPAPAIAEMFNQLDAYSRSREELGEPKAPKLDS